MPAASEMAFRPRSSFLAKAWSMPGSLASDEMLPAHSAAITENAHGIRFRQTLAMRESARKAFHDADNNMSLRRAALRRSRPDRGHYSPGEWVMYWRQSEVKQGWQGPAKVIQQDGTNTVFCVHMGTMVRVASEHVRPVSAVEAQLLPLDQSPEHVLSRSITNTNPIDQSIPTEVTTIHPGNNTTPPTDNSPNPIIPTPVINTEQESNAWRSTRSWAQCTITKSSRTAGDTPRRPTGSRSRSVRWWRACLRYSHMHGWWNGCFQCSRQSSWMETRARNRPQQVWHPKHILRRDHPSSHFTKEVENRSQTRSPDRWGTGRIWQGQNEWDQQLAEHRHSQQSLAIKPVTRTDPKMPMDPHMETSWRPKWQTQTWRQRSQSQVTTCCPGLPRPWVRINSKRQSYTW